MTGMPHAQHALGLDAGLAITSDEDENVSLRLIPTLILDHGSSLEVTPYAGIALEETSPWFASDVWDNYVIDGNTHLMLTGGCGFYFRLLDKEALSLLLGPDLFIEHYLYEDNGPGDGWLLTLGCRCPVLFEYTLTQRFFMRLRCNAGAISLGFRHRELPNGEDDTDTRFLFGMSSTANWFSLSAFMLL
jgi:hypothetical protein